MALYLVTAEFADEYNSLMHYRRGGEVKGVRRWQNEDGSYTPAGYEHYAEMYGWTKRRAERAGRKAEKYSQKASNAKLALDKQQVKYDKAQLKNDRRGDEKSAGRLSLEEKKLNEKKYNYDMLSAKANAYANKSEKLTARREAKIEKQMQKDKDRDSRGFKDPFLTLEEKEHDLVDRLFAKMLNRGKEPAQTDMAPDTKKAIDDFVEKLQKEAAEEKATEERVDNNRYVEGSKARQENIENKKQMENFDNLGAEDKRKVGDYLAKKMADYRNTYESGKELDDIDADFERDASEEYAKDSWWLAQKIDQVAGNENVGEYQPGSNGSKAHDDLMASYDKTYNRQKELISENRLDSRKINSGDKKERQKLLNVLKSDKLYQALAANDKKNEDALLSAVLKDLGFSDTAETRSMIYWYVFLD